MKHALLVVDVQNDFCPGGSLATEEGDAVANKIAVLLSDAHFYDLVLATKDWHIEPDDHFEHWPIHCVADSHGAELHPALKDCPFDAVFHKGEYAAAYSGFEGHYKDQSLEDYLRELQVTEIDVVGIATDYCVKATATDGVDKGFAVRILTDYVAAVAEEDGQRALKELEEHGATLIRAV